MNEYEKINKGFLEDGLPSPRWCSGDVLKTSLVTMAPYLYSGGN